MHSGIIVILVLVAISVAGVIWLEMHSRRNRKPSEQQELGKGREETVASK